MQDIKNSIEEYRESRECLQRRIHELNALIGKSSPCKENSSLKKLLERRYTLYTELWDIEYAIRELGEYLCLTHGLEVMQNAG